MAGCRAHAEAPRRQVHRGAGYAHGVGGPGTSEPAPDSHTIDRGDARRRVVVVVDPYGPSATSHGSLAPGVDPWPPGVTGTAVDGASRSTLGWWGSTIVVGLGAFFMGLFALWQASYISHKTVAETADKWDGVWYYEISQHGYLSVLPKPGGPYAADRPAFFPGLPLLEHVTHEVLGGSPGRTILFLGAIGLIVSCLVFRAFVGHMFDDAVAWRATILFAFFPGAYVFIYGYSELLAIPLAILTLYAIRRRWYLLAGVATLAATGTWLLGGALVVSLLIAAGRELLDARHAHRRDWRHVASAAVSPFLGVGGLVGYMVFLYERTGDFFAFMAAERIGWGNTVTLAHPYDVLRAFFAHPLGPPWTTDDGVGVIVLGACLVYLAVDGRRRLRAEEIAFAAIVLLAWLFTSNTGAWFRFVLMAFPLVALVAARIDRRFVPVLACACAALFGVLVVLFGTPAFTFAP